MAEAKKETAAQREERLKPREKRVGVHGEIRGFARNGFDSFGFEYSEWVDALGRARERILVSRTASERRTRILKRIVSQHALEQFRRTRQSAQRGAQ